MRADHVPVPGDHSPVKYAAQAGEDELLVWERDNPATAWMQSADFVEVRQ